MNNLLCAYCESGEAKHHDHVVPQSRGGSDDPENCLMACSTCNLEKSDRLPSEWRPVGLPAHIYDLEKTLRARFRMAPRARRGPSQGARLRGIYALWIEEDGGLAWQVRVGSHQRDGLYLVQIFGGGDKAPPTEVRLVHVRAMVAWRFYADESAWREAHARLGSRERMGDPRVPSHDGIGVPMFGTERAADGALCSANPFERALAVEFRSLPSDIKDALINVHDDLYAARKIAVSIYGRRWERHVAEVREMVRRERRALERKEEQ